MAGLWYRVGTISVTNSSKKVTGFGTQFKTGTYKPDKGHTFWGPDGKHYEVDYVESDTVLYLVQAYTGATAAGQSYEIDITRTGTTPALSREVSAMLTYAQGQYDSWQQILTGSGNVTLAAPDGQTISVPALSNMLSKSGNLAGLVSKEISRRNLGISEFADTLLDDADAAAMRSTLGAAPASSNMKTTTLQAPSGATAGKYYCVTIQQAYSPRQVTLSTRASIGSDPMNNCSFTGVVKDGGWQDTGSFIDGFFWQFSAAERAIHSVWGTSQNAGVIVFYVEAQAFPVDVAHPAACTVSVSAGDFVFGTATFTGNTDTPGGTNVSRLYNFTATGHVSNWGAYIGGYSVYHAGNTTPVAIGAVSATAGVANGLTINGTMAKRGSGDLIIGDQSEVANRELQIYNQSGNVIFRSDQTADGDAAGQFTLNGAKVTVNCTLSSKNVIPLLDNVYTYGSASYRISTVYAATGSINTSDARYKTPITPLTGAEVSAAVDMLNEVGTYQWLDMLAEKGSAARLHIGLTVQRAIEIMSAHGLDPLRYGFICHDSWEEQSDSGEIVRRTSRQVTIDEPVERDVIEIIDNVPTLRRVTETVSVPQTTLAGLVEAATGSPVLDERGDQVQVSIPMMEIVDERFTVIDRYSFRYDELTLFMLRGVLSVMPLS
jgi:hypothetical protein